MSRRALLPGAWFSASHDSIPSRKCVGTPSASEVLRPFLLVSVFLFAPDPLLLLRKVTVSRLVTRGVLTVQMEKLGSCCGLLHSFSLTLVADTQ